MTRLHRAERPDLPGPGLPVAVQTYYMATRAGEFLRSCRQRYGDIFRLRIAPTGEVVYLHRPEHLREVFTGPNDVFHAGEGNAILMPLMGEHSVLLLDDEAHLRMRRLLLPAFHGRQVRRFEPLIAELTEAEVGRWPVGRPFAVHPRMQALTFELILRVVLGVTDEQRLGELRPLIRQVLDIKPMLMLAWVRPALARVGPWRRYRQTLARTDELLYAEIAARRGLPGLADRDDVLSQLMALEGGERLTDAELRDQVVTLLLAGHETTATALAWACHELAHAEDQRSKARRAAEAGDEAWLDAVVKESLRLRPVIFDVARRLTAPAEVAGVRLPAGVTILPSIGLAHEDPARYPDPDRFDPSRFLDATPSAYSYLPFGGGIRRCLGAGLAMLEARVVLQTLLQRIEFSAGREHRERVRQRHITQVPAHGGQIVVTAVRPASGSAGRRSDPVAAGAAQDQPGGA